MGPTSVYLFLYHMVSQHLLGHNNIILVSKAYNTFDKSSTH